MKQWNIKELKEESWIGYNDGDIAIVDNLSRMKDRNFRQSSVNMVVMIFCLQGNGEIIINDRKWKIIPNDVLICTPNTFVDDYSTSEDFDAKVIGFSVDAMESKLYISKNIWHNLYYIMQNPVIRLKPKDMQIFYNYYYIAEAKLQNTNNVYYREIMHSLLSCFIYEFLLITDRYSSKEHKAEHTEIRHGDILFKNFIELLVQEKGMIRSVKEAAAKLNVTSKYLSAAIKTASGKNALEIIHHYTVQEIMRKLKYTDKTIQEISNDLDFPSMSFFGKFFKTHTGISPKQYRKNCSKADNDEE